MSNSTLNREKPDFTGHRDTGRRARVRADCRHLESLQSRRPRKLDSLLRVRFCCAAEALETSVRDVERDIEEDEVGLGVLQWSGVTTDGTGDVGWRAINFPKTDAYMTLRRRSLVNTRSLASGKETFSFVRTRRISRSYLYLFQTFEDTVWGSPQC